MTNENWLLTYNDIVGGVKNYGRESLLTLGNGFLGWRGALVTNAYDDDFYPGLYGAGIFNQTSTPVAGRDVINEDLVNLPNVALIKVQIDGKSLSINNSTIKSLKRSLNFKTGELTDDYQVQVADNSQHFVTIKTVKVINPVHWHQLGLRFQVTSNYDAHIAIDAIIDGSVENKNVARYRDFDSKEFDVKSVQDDLMIIKTRTTDVTVALAAKTIGESVEKTIKTENQVTTHIERDCHAGQSFTIERVMAIASSLETNGELAEFVQNETANTTFDEIQRESHDYWQSLWQTKDIQISGDDPMQKLTRMNIFHLNQMANPNANPYLDASVGSRGLTGEGYRGHIFWDELFALPYYSANEPKSASAVLNYRTKRLSAAEKNAI